MWTAVKSHEYWIIMYSNWPALNVENIPRSSSTESETTRKCHNQNHSMYGFSRVHEDILTFWRPFVQIMIKWFSYLVNWIIKKKQTLFNASHIRSYLSISQLLNHRIEIKHQMYFLTNWNLVTNMHRKTHAKWKINGI